jgi:hypothetical protein
MRLVLEDPIARPVEIRPDFPSVLDKIIMRALERDPARRYQTAKALASDLEEVLRERKYGAKNDQIAQYMEATFATRIAARERVLQDLAGKRQLTEETLDAAFGETITHAGSTISSTGDVATGDEPTGSLTGETIAEPIAETIAEPLAETIATRDDEPAHESTTIKTAPNPPDWKPGQPMPPVMPPAAPAPAMATPTPAPRPHSPTRPGLGQLTPAAFSQPRPRPTNEALPKPFSIAGLLDQSTEIEPIRPSDPLLQRPAAGPIPPAAPAPAKPSPPALAAMPDPPVLAAMPSPPVLAAMPSPPVLAAMPNPPVLPSQPPLPRLHAAPNPFEETEDDDLKTVADVIPANPEASRSLQSEPSWTVARQGSSLGELQRWVEESRTPPRTRWEAVARKLSQLHQRAIAWSLRHGLPPWSPLAALVTALIGLLILVGMCTGGPPAATQAAPGQPSGSAQGAPADEKPAPDEEIEMSEDVVRPPPPAPPSRRRP